MAAQRDGWLLAGQVIGFVAGIADELASACVGCAPVLPRAARWLRRARTEWRAYRAGVIDAEIVAEDGKGVWR